MKVELMGASFKMKIEKKKIYLCDNIFQEI